MGNGFQQKPYLYVDDIVNAISTPVKKKEFSFGLKEFNLSPRDDGIKIGKIAELFLKYKKLNIPIVYSGGERGWDGDVPKYSYDYKKNNGLKWIPKHNSISSIIKTIKKLSK